MLYHISRERTAVYPVFNNESDECNNDGDKLRN